MDGSVYLISVAIDIGTTFSGCAYSTLHEYNTDPASVKSMNWRANTGNLVSEKTSTCVLFDPTEKFHSFGYKAEDKYSNLSLEESHQNWYFFRRFKMELYEKEIIRNMMLKAIDGKEMKAMTVISALIKGLKDHFLAELEKQGSGFEDSDIRWVLTVPAIWSDNAKQFMRESAVQAGICEDKLILALEPEAASVYCKHVRTAESKFEVFQPGAEYLVLDAGGGTIDITVHRVKGDGHLEELHCANGGDWGGTRVDERFEKCLQDAIGESVFKLWKNENVFDTLELFRSFEVKKRQISRDMEDRLVFSIPSSLTEAIHSASTEKVYSDQVVIRKGRLFIDPCSAKGFFQTSIDRISEHIQNLMEKKEIKNIPSILMVGGYSECSLLQEEIKKAFPKLNVVVPSDAGLAVLKGAVLIGHNPNAISTRICKYTYGVQVNPLFIYGKHDEKKSFLNDSRIKLCKDIFDIYATKDETIRLDKPLPTRPYKVIDKDQTQMEVTIYASTDRNPLYVTERSCQKLGTMTVETPDTWRGLDRRAEVTMNFGGTEIEVKAVNMQDGKVYETHVNFLG